jgi:hypothetical protein
VGVEMLLCNHNAETSSLLRINLILSRRILAAFYSPRFEASIVVQAWKAK